jgi:hypothetical protein
MRFGRGDDGHASIAQRVYRVLLLAYPKRFRREYGTCMEQAFRDLYREEACRSGGIGLVRLWVRVGRDLASSAVVERGRVRVEGKEITVSNYKLAGVGFVLLLAPLYFVSASLLKYGLGVGFLFDPLEFFLSQPGRRYVFNLVSPVVFLGGLVLALALNGYSFVRVGVGREDGAIVGTARLEMKPANVAVAMVSLLLLGTLVGYVFVENFAYRY